MKQTPLRTQIRGLIRLTRWKEYIAFVVPLTVLGALLAARPNGILLDWRLIVVTLANILAVAYAFMINDIEDAPDDARDPARHDRRDDVRERHAEGRDGVARLRAVLPPRLRAATGRVPTSPSGGRLRGAGAPASA